MEFNEPPQINIEAELKKLSKFIDPINFQSVEERAESSFESFSVPDAEFSKSIEINSLPESEFFSSQENINLESSEVPKSIEINSLPESEFFKSTDLLDFTNSNNENNYNLNSSILEENIDLKNKINKISTEIENVKSYVTGPLNNELISFATQVNKRVNRKEPKNYQSQIVTIVPTNSYIKDVIDRARVVPSWV